MRHLDLFSGIGGFALAARWANWRTIGFCELDPYCQKVLTKNFPGVPIHDDIKTYTGSEGSADIITGGFPCQDISVAGTGVGIEGERSGLWSELARIIGEVRPRYAVLENVAALLSRGLDRVTGDLAEIGYDCEWHCIPASAVGAPHRRDRIWIVAYSGSDGIRHKSGWLNGQDWQGQAESWDDGAQGNVADTNKPRLAGRLRRILQERAYKRATWATGALRDSDHEDESGCAEYAGPWSSLPEHAKWFIEPDVGRVANGVPARMDRLKGLGNSILPQLGQIIFEAINDVENIKTMG